MAEDELTQKAREAVSKRLTALYGKPNAQAAFRAATGYDFWASAIQAGQTREAIAAAVEAYIADNPPPSKAAEGASRPPAQRQEQPGGDVANVQGRPYLKAGARARRFRKAHPAGCIRTEMLSLAEGEAVFRADVLNGDGQLLATGHARATAASSKQAGGRFVEMAETNAIARALGLAGFGDPND